MINKIDGLGPIRTAQPLKRTAKTGSTDSTSFASHIEESSETDASSGIASTNSIAGVLGVQEVDDALAHASRGKMRAQDILDRLEDMRIEILTGTISREKLIQLARVISTRRAQVTDPRLTEILDEIDLRAQVELAKYSQNNR